MAIKFLNLSKKFKTVRPNGFKFPTGLSYGSANNTNAGVATKSKSLGADLSLNEVSGPTSNSAVTFNSSGTFIPAFTGDVEILVVGAGGAGGPAGDRGGGGGGGAGGVKYISGQPVVMDSSYVVTVGGGGAVSPPSYFVAISSSWSGSESNVAPIGIYGTGGGGGGKGGAPNPFPAYIGGGPSPISNGAAGGSGGGGSSPGYSQETAPGGAANTTGGQVGFGGQAGAKLDFYNTPAYGNGGGGGGAGQAGQARANTEASSPGGNGVEYSISGVETYYGGGGGGGGSYVANNAPGSVRAQYYIGFGGNGGGGEGGMVFSTDHLPQPARLIAGTADGPYPVSANQQLAIDLGVGVAGTINRGGGGGGGGALQPNPTAQPAILAGSGAYNLAGSGGSGVVIFRFNTFQATSNTYIIN